MAINPFHFNKLSYHDKYQLPEASGIYYVLNLKTHSILYIGRSDNIRKRWVGHHRKEDLSHISDTFGSYQLCIAWELRPKQGLDKAEARRIEMFKPPLNGANAEDSITAVIRECAKLYDQGL